jgi:hypothetical protein
MSRCSWCKLVSYAMLVCIHSTVVVVVTVTVTVTGGRGLPPRMRRWHHRGHGVAPALSRRPASTGLLHMLTR